jgi:hypothetical protein
MTFSDYHAAQAVAPIAYVVFLNSFSYLICSTLAFSGGGSRLSLQVLAGCHIIIIAGSEEEF